MLDANGRLWGKVNLIDLAVVLLFIAAVSFYLLTRSDRKLATAVPQTMVTIRVDSEAVHPGVAEEIKPGDEITIFNGSTNLIIGKVDHIEFQPYPFRASTSDGRLVVAPDPIQKLVKVTITGPGLVGKNVITMNNQLVMLGARFTLRSKASSFLVAVRELRLTEAPQGAQ